MLVGLPNRLKLWYLLVPPLGVVTGVIGGIYYGVVTLGPNATPVTVLGEAAHIIVINTVIMAAFVLYEAVFRDNA